MSKENFILHDEFSKPLIEKDFIKAKKEYIEYLKKYPFSIKDAKDIFDLIQNVKRSPQDIGPYKNISVFEALNRIGTDLVLLSGAAIMFNGDKYPSIKLRTIKLNMGTTRGIDCIIETMDNRVIFGEAFNAAKSFCKEKMRQAIHSLAKVTNKPPCEAFIFINEEMETTIAKYRENNKVEKFYPQIDFITVFCNTKTLNP
jgi:hypothetical protein